MRRADSRCLNSFVKQRVRDCALGGIESGFPSYQLRGHKHGGKMAEKKQDFIDQRLQDLNNDGVDRRGFLKCMAWAGTGLVWTLSGGVPVSRAFAKNGEKKMAKGSDFTFVQISDSHIGFDKPANPNVTATLQFAIDKINALPE